MTTPVAHTARDDAQTVAVEAKGQAQNVAVEAKGQAQNVAVEAKQQARDLAGELNSQLREQSDVQRDRAVSTLRDLGQELREMADGGDQSGLASDLARRASDQVQGVSGYLEGRAPGDLLDDLRSFARRRPGAFLLGAAVAGVLAGRATRGVRAATSDSSAPSPTTGPAYAAPPAPGAAGTAAGRPLDGLDAAGTRYDAAVDPAFGLEPDLAARRLP